MTGPRARGHRREVFRPPRAAAHAAGRREPVPSAPFPSLPSSLSTSLSSS